MYPVLPQPGARASAAIAMVVVVAGIVLAVVVVRGVLATGSILTWMDGTTPLVESVSRAPPLPRSPK